MNKHSSLTSDCRGATYIMLQEKKTQKKPKKKVQTKKSNQSNKKHTQRSKTRCLCLERMNSLCSLLAATLLRRDAKVNNESCRDDS